MRSNSEISSHAAVTAVENCGQASIALLRLKAIDKGVKIASATTMNLILLVFLLLFVLMTNITAGFMLGDLMGRNYLGFLAVCAVDGILLLIVFTLRHVIKQRLSNTYISNLLSQDIQKITNSEELKIAISQLETEHKASIAILKTELQRLRENLTPLGMLNNFAAQLPGASELKEALSDKAAGFLLKYFPKGQAPEEQRNKKSPILRTFLRVGLILLSSRLALKSKNQ